MLRYTRDPEEGGQGPLLEGEEAAICHLGNGEALRLSRGSWGGRPGFGSSHFCFPEDARAPPKQAAGPGSTRQLPWEAGAQGRSWGRAGVGVERAARWPGAHRTSFWGAGRGSDVDHPLWEEVLSMWLQPARRLASWSPGP